MEFKIGDRVNNRGKGNGTVIALSGSNIGVEYDEYFGGHKCESYDEGRSGKSGYCWWKLEEDIKKIGGNMKKEYLKDGDIVTLKNGDRLVLFSGGFTDLEREGHWIDDLDDYEDDLRTCDRFYDEYDIVKVERPVEYETVFTRDDAVELTVDEISEKLGYKVKVVGEDR